VTSGEQGLKAKNENRKAIPLGRDEVRETKNEERKSKNENRKTADRRGEKRKISILGMLGKR